MVLMKPVLSSTLEINIIYIFTEFSSSSQVKEAHPFNDHMNEHGRGIIHCGGKCWSRKLEAIPITFSLEIILLKIGSLLH